eukprot:1032123-Prymnesium_polylepis.2
MSNTVANTFTPPHNPGAGRAPCSVGLDGRRKHHAGAIYRVNRLTHSSVVTTAAGSDPEILALARNVPCTTVNYGATETRLAQDRAEVDFFFASFVFVWSAGTEHENVS